MESNCSSSARLGAGETESSSSPNTRLLPLATSPVLSLPKGFPQSHFIILKKAPFPTFFRGNSKGFRRSVAKNGIKDKYLFLIINRNITDPFRSGTVSSNPSAQTLGFVFMTFPSLVQPSLGSFAHSCTSPSLVKVCFSAAGSRDKGFPGE